MAALSRIIGFPINFYEICSQLGLILSLYITLILNLKSL